MYGYEPLKPSLWKAWVFTPPLAFFVAWSLVSLAHMPAAPAYVLAVIFSFVTAFFINGRVQKDWRATDTMKARHFDAYTGTDRPYRVKKD